MDWNNDGKLDLISGDSDGNVWVFINSGVKGAPKLEAGKLVEADGKVIKASIEHYKQVDNKWVVDHVTTGSHELAKIYSKVHLADWDDDGLKDLLVGHDLEIILYKNTGTPSEPRFLAPVLIPVPEGKYSSRPSPYVVDFDADGKKDLVVGSERNEIKFYRNIGTSKNPVLANAEVIPLKAEGKDRWYRCRIDVVDWNNDGKLDILLGNCFSDKNKTLGNVWLFLQK